MEYHVTRRIGRGGMGVVDLAVDDAGHEVALKRLALHGTPEELDTARQRIRREAEVLRTLHHPGIVPLLDLVDADDDVILVMPYLAGGNLAQRVADGGPLPPDAVDGLADELLDALAVAHRHGVVHRDIKPSNVLFDASGRAHLADFGVARTRDATVGLTATQMVVGTPGFMAPEQARGEPATAASDVFSLGATLAFAATGRGPFGTGEPRVLMLRAAAGKFEKLPRELPADLRRRLAPMLDRDPAKRPTAANARGGTGGPAGTNPQRAPRSAPPGRAHRWGVALASGAVLLAAIGVAVLADRGDHHGAAARGAAAGHRTATTSAPCRPLKYRPCGHRPAPGTDGRRCIDDRADYDGREADGCEAIPDANPDGLRISGGVAGNLVPRDDVDTYVVAVADRFQLLCNGQVHVTLTAPSGVSQRLTVLRDDTEVGTTTSSDRDPAEVVLDDPNCGTDDSGDLTLRVSSIGTDRSPADYHLEVTGSY